MKVTLLTGGGDKPYALGLVAALASAGVDVDFIASDDFLDVHELWKDQVRFLNLRGNMDSSSSLISKLDRIARYHVRLFAYATRSDAKVFHTLWANRFLLIERVLLPSYYKLLGKRIVYTVHNVNERERDGGDDLVNRLTLRLFYGLVDHFFVHTAKMRAQLIADFGIRDSRITVVPFGINNTLPRSGITRLAARDRLRLLHDERVILFFGNIAPYKGLEYAVEALALLKSSGKSFRLIIAGNVKGCQPYWSSIEQQIADAGLTENVTQMIGYVPDEDVEVLFQAADVLVLPYKFIYQSGVLFLAYSFGLPVIATDVGSLREDIIDGFNGMICRSLDADSLARAVESYFEGDLYRDLDRRRASIFNHCNERHSWDEVARITSSVYQALAAPQG